MPNYVKPLLPINQSGVFDMKILYIIVATLTCKPPNLQEITSTLSDQINDVELDMAQIMQR